VPNALLLKVHHGLDGLAERAVREDELLIEQRGHGSALRHASAAHVHASGEQLRLGAGGVRHEREGELRLRGEQHVRRDDVEEFLRKRYA